MSAPYLIGQTLVATDGKIKLWAERGLVCIEDTRDNSFQQVSVKTALERAKAINDMLGKSSEYGIELDRTHRLRMQTFVEDVVRVCRKALEQGEPFDKSAQRDRRLARPRSFAVGASLSKRNTFDNKPAPSGYQL